MAPIADKTRLLALAGPVEDLRVPRVREGDFHPRSCPIAAAALTAFRSHLGPRRLWAQPSRHLPSHPGRGRGGAGLADTSRGRGLLRGVFGRNVSLHPGGKREGARVSRVGPKARRAPRDLWVLALLGGRGRGSVRDRSTPSWSPAGRPKLTPFSCSSGILSRSDDIFTLQPSSRAWRRK